MKQTYIDKKFSSARLELIAHMRDITERYMADGLDLTLRQLYYRLVAANIIPNTEQSYKRIGTLLGDARLAGLIDWAVIVDRGRALQDFTTWSGPDQILNAAAYSLRYDHWLDQPERVEVWVEKQALISVVARACQAFRVPHFACKGYVSHTAMYEAAQRHVRHFERNQQHITVLYLGDHDPSGLQMAQDVQTRLLLLGSLARVETIALTREQVDAANAAPNPAKLTDPRSKKYVAEHGPVSWELDALQPRDLISLISDAIYARVDHEVFEANGARENEDKAALRQVARDFEAR